MQRARLLLTLGLVFRNSAPLRALVLFEQGLHLARPAGDDRLLYRLFCACALTQARASSKLVFVAGLMLTALAGLMLW